jgi:hypothetical protein
LPMAMLGPICVRRSQMKLLCSASPSTFLHVRAHIPGIAR